MFNPFEWWRTRRKALPPGALTDMITEIDPADTPLLNSKSPPTLRQYALSQLDRTERSKTNGKGSQLP